MAPCDCGTLPTPGRNAKRAQALDSTRKSRRGEGRIFPWHLGGEGELGATERGEARAEGWTSGCTCKIFERARLARPPRTARPPRLARPPRTARPPRLARPPRTARPSRLARPPRTARPPRLARLARPSRTPPCPPNPKQPARRATKPQERFYAVGRYHPTCLDPTFPKTACSPSGEPLPATRQNVGTSTQLSTFRHFRLAALQPGAQKLPKRCIAPTTRCCIFATLSYRRNTHTPPRRASARNQLAAHR
jgi:hypothetical protein